MRGKWGVLGEGVMVPLGFVVTNEAFSSTHACTLKEGTLYVVDAGLISQ